MNQSLFEVFFQLGVHIGSMKNRTLSTSNFFILGNRNGVDLIDLKKSVFFLQKSLFFLKELGKSGGNLLVHYTALHQYDINIKLYLVNLIVNQTNQSFFDEKWTFGQLSNFRVHAKKMIEDLFLCHQSFIGENEFKAEFKRLKNRKVERIFTNVKSYKLSNLRFFDILVRIVFATYSRFMEGINWDSHLFIMQKYWRFILFFKFFKSFIQMPDVFILANSNHYYAPLLESSRLKMPIISIVDTDTNPYLTSYPIYSNDDSIILVLFYFQLMMNSYQIGRNFNFLNFKI